MQCTSNAKIQWLGSTSSVALVGEPAPSVELSGLKNATNSYRGTAKTVLHYFQVVFPVKRGHSAATQRTDNDL